MAQANTNGRAIINSTGRIASYPAIADKRHALPKVEVYRAWLAEQLPQGRAVSRSSAIDEHKLRRIAVMKRDAAFASHIARAVGVSAETVSRWYKQLPDELK